MKCPLFTAAEIAHEPELKPQGNDCLQSECALWDDGHPGCAILTIAQELATKRQKEEVDP